MSPTAINLIHAQAVQSSRTQRRFRRR